jgi:hypothetical protein
VYKRIGSYILSKKILRWDMPHVWWNDITKKVHPIRNEYELGRKEVFLQKFKYVAYDIDGQ